jgi:hypothetical protein
MANNLNPFDILRKRNTSSQQMGCRRPGCGCLIFIVLLLLAGSFLFKYMGGSIPTITLPGGGTIFNEQQEEEKDTDDFDFNRDKDYGKKLKKLNEDDIDGI